MQLFEDPPPIFDERMIQLPMPWEKCVMKLGDYLEKLI